MTKNLVRCYALLAVGLIAGVRCSPSGEVAAASQATGPGPRCAVNPCDYMAPDPSASGALLVTLVPQLSIEVARAVRVAY
jgi:hypothetical protein